MTTTLGAALRDAGLIPDTPVVHHQPAPTTARMAMLGMVVGDDPYTWLQVQYQKCGLERWRDVDNIGSATAEFVSDEGDKIRLKWDLYRDEDLAALARYEATRDRSDRYAPIYHYEK